MVNDTEDKDAARVDTSRRVTCPVTGDDCVNCQSNHPACVALRAPEASASTTDPLQTIEGRTIEGMALLATLPKELGAVLRIGMLPHNIVVVACENGACLVYANGNVQALSP